MLPESTQPPELNNRSGRLPKLPTNIWVLTVTSFLTDVSSEMVFNLLPLFLANVLGLHTGLIGLIEGIAQTTASLLKIVSGWLSDRLGKRKWLTIAGYGISTIAKPFLYWASSWWAVLAVRFADRVGKGIRTAPRDALIADSSGADRRGLAFGIQRAGDTAGAAVGLSVAILVVWLLQGSSITLKRETFQTLILLSVIPSTLAVLVLIVGLREPQRQTQPGKRPLRPSFRNLGRRFYTFLAILILFTLGNSSDAFILLRAQERGVSINGLLGSLLIFNIVYAITAAPAGTLSDRLGRRKLIIIGWLTYVFVYVGLALASKTWQIWMLFPLYGLYYGLTEGSSKALVSDLVPADLRGSAYGAFNAATGLALFPASLLAGILWQGIGSWPGLGPRAPFFLGAASALLATLLLAGLDLQSGISTAQK